MQPIQNIDYGTGGGFTLDAIWTNTDDTQSMNAGNIAELTNQLTYQAFLIEYKRYKDGADYLTMIVFPNKKYKLGAVDGNTNESRLCTITVSGSSITVNVESGYVGGSANQGYIVVSRVFGIR